MDPMILSTTPMPAWCLGRVTLNLMLANLMLREEITFISVLIRSLPALAIFSLECPAEQMFFGIL